mmetsp:Transcript_36059/g.58265  ORF Transcript_36059/g.58265 Transcript_36059/m.58265 type:complete len:103 (+) Transcript_36059:196-504(+)
MIPYHLKQALAHDLHIPTKTQFPSYIYTNKLHLLIKYWGRETQACSPSAKSDSAKVKKQLPVSVQFISPPPPFFPLFFFFFSPSISSVSNPIRLFDLSHLYR